MTLVRHSKHIAGDSRASSFVWRTASLHSGFGVMAWRVNLRSADSQREPRAGNVALWNLADFSRLFRSDHDSLFAQVSRPPTALFWHGGYARDLGRAGNYRLAFSGEVRSACASHAGSRSTHDFCCGAIVGRTESTGDRAFRRTSGSPLPRAHTARTVFA